MAEIDPSNIGLLDEKEKALRRQYIDENQDFWNKLDSKWKNKKDGIPLWDQDAPLQDCFTSFTPYWTLQRYYVAGPYSDFLMNSPQHPLVLAAINTCVCGVPEEYGQCGRCFDTVAQLRNHIMGEHKNILGGPANVKPLEDVPADGSKAANDMKLILDDFVRGRYWQRQWYKIQDREPDELWTPPYLKDAIDRANSDSGSKDRRALEMGMGYGRERHDYKSRAKPVA